ncbi:MAG: hypothetical protein KF680_06700 [Cryobacterium sp.]|nr:hypothetical protein [Cryobacterium sp.]
MNTVLPTVQRDERSHVQPHSPPVAAPQRVARVSLLDRVAMRLGLALLTWSRRRGAVDERQAARAHFERDRAQQLRDRAAERTNRLLAVLR